MTLDEHWLGLFSELALNFSAAYFFATFIAPFYHTNAILFYTNLVYGIGFLFLSYLFRKQKENYDNS